MPDMTWEELSRMLASDLMKDLYWSGPGRNVSGRAIPPQRVDQIMKERREQKMNTYERQYVKSFMTIEYGTAATIPQLIIAEAYFQVVANQIKANGHDVPKELDEALRACSRDLSEKLRADRLREIRGLELQAEQLATAEEKRAKINERLKELRELTK
jgi:hypothetical protein